LPECTCLERYAELEKLFVITFLEAPNPMANSAMESWAKALRNS